MLSNLFPRAFVMKYGRSLMFITYMDEDLVFAKSCPGFRVNQTDLALTAVRACEIQCCEISIEQSCPPHVLSEAQAH